MNEPDTTFKPLADSVHRVVDTVATMRSQDMAEKQTLAVRDPAPSMPAVTTPMDMLNRAVAQGAGLDVVKGLMDLYERWEAGLARKAFDAAVSAAKGEIPTITKNRVVDFTSQKGRTNYRHEDFAEIASTVDPVLFRHGLSYRHRATQDGNKLKVTCILSHRDGCSEETSLEAAEDHTGNKNGLQAIASAATYLQRYTLKLALGLAISNDDDANSTTVVDNVTDEQVIELQDLMIQTGIEPARLLQRIGVEFLRDVPARRFAEVKRKLLDTVAHAEQRRRAGEKAAQ